MHNRLPLPDSAPFPNSFLEVDQSFVVEKESRAKLDAITKFVAEIRGSGFIRAWTERAKI